MGWKWIVAIALSAYLFKSYLLCYNVLLVLIGSFIGFIGTLIFYDNKYVAILAHVISSKLSTLTDAKSFYKDILLNMSVDTMWFNVGYWKDVEQSSNSQSSKNAFVRACEEMTSLLTSSVGISDGDTILVPDVGCGSGEQDIFMWEHHKNSKIVAIELSPNQVKYARNKASALGISDKILFEVGNAVELSTVVDKKEVKEYLGVQSATFDAVLALDCAYHFQYRDDFFLQACDVLRVEGRVGLADICLADGVDMNNLNPIFRFGLKWMLRRMSIPPENLVDMQTYRNRLEKCGFRNIMITPITEHVFPGLLKFTEDVDSQLGFVLKAYRRNKLRGVTSFLRKIISRGLLEYVIVSGVKMNRW